jgi:uroporphyrinogen decarboxylase
MKATYMILTPKERLRRALLRQPIDRIPTQINYTASMGQKLAVHFNTSTADLPKLLDNHFVRVDLTYPTRLSDDGKVRFDWWSAGHDTGEEGYYIPVNPLKESTDLEAFPWPDPHDPHLLDDAARTIHASSDEYFIAPNFGFALFERAWSLRGFEQIFMDLGRDPDFVGALLDRITAIQLILIQRFIELGVDGGYFGDDYGAQKNLLFSPVQWRKLIKPRLARLFAPFVERGLPVIMHSDGQIQKILPDLIEIGLTTLNPVQPEVLDHHWLHENFKDKLSFYGGISTQTVLPYGSPAEVQSAVQQCARVLAPVKTGLLISPSHRMLTDIPLSNVEAMLAAFREL